MKRSNILNKAHLIFILAILHLSLCSQEIKLIDLKSHFDKFGVDGCFVLYDKSGDFYLCYNPARCDSGYLPASTFKIPNAVIALEEKVITDTGQVIEWDGREWPHESWNQDQTLRSAIKYSCVWVFFRIADKVGIEKYHRYFNSFGYGNRNPGGPPDRFWLAGDLRINAFQQVDFLRKFYDYELNVSRETIDMVKEIIILENTGDYRLSGKTGGTEISGNESIMWLVGYIELDTDVYFYAMNFTTGDYSGTRHARYEITRNVLKSIRLIE
ncbi:MAG: class D beta-lactamase [Bacteroidales bacterium]|nr:class D beta-lactamase [Bacteroidales bacterium]